MDPSDAPRPGSRAVAALLPNEPGAMTMLTFRQAQEAIYDVLRKRGWTVESRLKMPHATSPNGTFRLWFKPQALHYTVVPRGMRHVAGDARSLSYELDIRRVDPESLIRWIEQTHREAQ